MSPSLLLYAFHCFNCWIILEKLSCYKSISFTFISFFSLVIACLFVSLFVSCHIGNLKRGLVPSLEEFDSRSKGKTTLRAIGLRSTPIWVNHQRENNHQNWGPCCNFVIDNYLLSLLSNFVTKRPFIGSKLGASNRSPYFHLCVIILGNFPLGLWLFCWKP